VVVLRTDSTKLYDRLKARNYPEKKLQENLDSEIMEVLLEEARDGFDADIVVELRSDEVGDLQSNVERIEAWIENWKKDNTGKED
jgi:adenylate kinase